MTEPTNESQPSGSSEPPRPLPSAAPPDPPGPLGPPPGPPLQPTAPQFAPILRVPWVNPDRRAQLTATAVGAAALLLAAGFGIGYAVAPSDNGHPRMRNVYPGLVLRPGLHPHLRPMPRIIPIPHGATTTVTVTPTPSPTST